MAIKPLCSDNIDLLFSQNASLTRIDQNVKDQLIQEVIKIPRVISTLPMISHDHKNIKAHVRVPLSIENGSLAALPSPVAD